VLDFDEEVDDVSEDVEEASELGVVSEELSLKLDVSVVDPEVDVEDTFDELDSPLLEECAAAHVTVSVARVVDPILADIVELPAVEEETDPVVTPETLVVADGWVSESSREVLKTTVWPANGLE
jgi:hypothetical protein